jgi:hypothetical protein
MVLLFARSNGRLTDLPLARGEHILATERDSTGATVVATTRALYLQPDGDPAWRRLGWEETGRICWDRHRNVLDLTGAAPDWGHVHLNLTRRSPMVALLNERVAACQLASARVSLPDGHTATVQARRRPGAAEVTWLVVLDRTTDGADPAVQAVVQSAIRALRTELGLASLS